MCGYTYSRHLTAKPDSLLHIWCNLCYISLDPLRERDNLSSKHTCFSPMLILRCISVTAKPLYNRVPNSVRVWRFHCTHNLTRYNILYTQCTFSVPSQASDGWCCCIHTCVPTECCGFPLLAVVVVRRGSPGAGRGAEFGEGVTCE